MICPTCLDDVADVQSVLVTLYDASPSPIVRLWTGYTCCVSCQGLYTVDFLVGDRAWVAILANWKAVQTARVPLRRRTLVEYAHVIESNRQRRIDHASTLAAQRRDQKRTQVVRASGLAPFEL